MQKISNMTPEEKAYLLYTTYRFAMAGLNADSGVNTDSIAKQCALIAVGEIMRMPNIGYNHNQDESQYDYWQEVKQEIELLGK